MPNSFEPGSTLNPVPFPQLPDEARLWTFAASRPLSAAEAERLLGRVDAHLAQWRAHGRPVVGAREWREDRFLLVAADERASGVSGCGIDSLFHALGEAERELGVTLRDRSRVWFRDRAGEVRALGRPEFRALVRGGEVDGETRVFDHTAETVGDERTGRWERPLRTSWHAEVFLHDTGSGREG